MARRRLNRNLTLIMPNGRQPGCTALAQVSRIHADVLAKRRAGQKGRDTVQNFRPREHDGNSASRRLMQRLDHAAGIMNSFLMVIALGLAGLLFTSLLAFHLPALPTMQFSAPLAAPAVVGSPGSH
jgi:hypothetical protein